MNTSPFRVDRRADRTRANRRRPEWLEVAEAGILYFGLTLLPLFVVILLHQLGVIA